MITQVFPDEFHLNTLDQLLSAIARLNPHVNIKAIVIGLMDRLSSYAARESESEPIENRRKNEEDAIANLMEKLQVAKETRPENTQTESSNKQEIGELVEGDKVAEPSMSNVHQSPVADSESGAEKSPPEKNRGIPDNVKLYEIFYDQVVNLVNAQRLQIQDTIALLVSLINLAL